MGKIIIIVVSGRHCYSIACNISNSLDWISPLQRFTVNILIPTTKTLVSNFSKNFPHSSNLSMFFVVVVIVGFFCCVVVDLIDSNWMRWFGNVGSFGCIGNQVHVVVVTARFPKRLSGKCCIWKVLAIETRQPERGCKKKHFIFFLGYLIKSTL